MGGDFSHVSHFPGLDSGKPKEPAPLPPDFSIIPRGGLVIITRKSGRPGKLFQICGDPQARPRQQLRGGSLLFMQIKAR